MSQRHLELLNKKRKAGLTAEESAELKNLTQEFRKRAKVKQGTPEFEAMIEAKSPDPKIRAALRKFLVALYSSLNGTDVN